MAGYQLRAAAPIELHLGEASGEESEVTFGLAPQGEDVLLVLTHRRLGDRTTMVGVASGWHAHLGILAEHLNGHVPRPVWSAHARAEAAYKRWLAPE